MSEVVVAAGEDVRQRLAQHLRYHTPADERCLSCGAARLVATLEPPTPGNTAYETLQTRLSAVVAVAGRVHDEIEVTLDLLNREHGPQAQAALASIAATTTPGDAIDTILARAAEQQPDTQAQAWDRLAAAEARLGRIAAAHTELVAQSRPRGFFSTRRTDALRDAVRALAIAWHGDVPDDSCAPLTTQSR